MINLLNILIMLCQCFFFEHNYFLYINMKPGTKNSYNSLKKKLIIKIIIIIH